MQDSEQFPDDVPVADAVEQERTAGVPDLDDDMPGKSAEAPLEATGADWQEQREVIEADPEFDEPNR